MTHTELVVASSIWLRRMCKVVCTEISSKLLSESPDVIGWKYDGTSVLLECKVSRADFLADKNKKSRAKAGLGQIRYYVCPEGVIKTEDLPPGWGLITYENYKFTVVKTCSKGRSSFAEERILLVQISRFQNDSKWCIKHNFYAEFQDKY